MTRRALGPTTSRTTCGTTSPTNPIRPLIATAAAVAMAAIAEQDPALAADVDAEMAGGRRRRAGDRRGRGPCRGSAPHATRMIGAATARRIHDEPPSPPSRYEKISRRFWPDMYIAIVSNAARIEPTA